MVVGLILGGGFADSVGSDLVVGSNLSSLTFSLTWWWVALVLGRAGLGCGWWVALQLGFCVFY